MHKHLIKLAGQWNHRTAQENSDINTNWLSSNVVGFDQINLNIKPWVFSIAPKTAGRSLDNYLTQVFSLKDILHVDSDKLNALPQVLYLHNKCADAITGEFSIDDMLYQLLPNQKFVHLGMMREPVMRVVYLYNDAATNQLYTKKDTGPLGFESYLHEINPVEINNGQAKRLAGVLNSEIELTDKELYFKAKFVIDNCFSLIGITEQFKEFYQFLGKISGVKFHNLAPIVRSRLKVQLTDLSPEYLSVINQKNRVDIQLYQYVKSQFEKLLFR